MKKIRSIEDLKNLNGHINHILTLFSGGLDSTYLLELLKHTDAKVTALVIDLGDDIDFVQLTNITKHYGVDLVIENASQHFVQYAIASAIQANAMYLGEYPVSSSLSRPIMAHYAVNVARNLKCDTILHTANQSQNSLRRINGAIKSSGFEGYYGSPYEYSATSRAQKISELSIAGLFGFKNRSESGDSNLWCREFESGKLDNPEDFDLSEKLFKWSVWEPTKHFKGDLLTLTFCKGFPTKINGYSLPLLAMVDYLNKHVGAYKIGRYIGFDHLEEDEKVLEIREAPAATALMSAYRHLEKATLPTNVLLLKSQLNSIWTNEAVEGRWGSTLQRSTQAFIEYTSRKITGEVTFSLSESQLFMSNIIAERPLYLTDRDGWEIETAYQRSQRVITTPIVDKQAMSA